MTTDSDRYLLHSLRSTDYARYAQVIFAPDAKSRTLLAALSLLQQELASIPATTTEPMVGLIRLQWWREALEALSAGTVKEHPVLTGLAPLYADNPPPEALTERLLTAYERQVEAEAQGDMAAFARRAEDTEGALFALFLHALGVEEEALTKALPPMSTAYALAMLLRHAPYTLPQRRCPLPGDIVAKHGLSLDHYGSAAFHAQCIAVMQEISDQAQAACGAAEALLTPLPRPLRRRAKPVLLALPITRHYLKRAARQHYDILSRPLTQQHLRLLFTCWRGK